MLEKIAPECLPRQVAAGEPLRLTHPGRHGWAWPAAYSAPCGPFRRLAGERRFPRRSPLACRDHGARPWPSGRFGPLSGERSQSHTIDICCRACSTTLARCLSARSTFNGHPVSGSSSLDCHEARRHANGGHPKRNREKSKEDLPPQRPRDPPTQPFHASAPVGEQYV